MLNAQELMKLASQYEKHVVVLSGNITECIADIETVTTSGVALKTALAEWQQHLERAIVQNRKTMGGVGATALNGDAPVADLVFDYLKAHPGATASAITAFLAEQRGRVSKSAIQYAFGVLRERKQITARGSRSHRTYWPKEARA